MGNIGRQLALVSLHLSTTTPYNLAHRLSSIIVGCSRITRTAKNTTTNSARVASSGQPPPRAMTHPHSLTLFQTKHFKSEREKNTTATTTIDVGDDVVIDSRLCVVAIVVNCVYGVCTYEPFVCVFVFFF